MTGLRDAFRTMVARERSAFTRPVTCPFWRSSVAAGVMAAAGWLLDESWVAALIATTVAYVLVDWDWIRASWRTGPA